MIMKIEKNILFIFLILCFSKISAVDHIQEFRDFVTNIIGSAQDAIDGKSKAEYGAKYTKVDKIYNQLRQNVSNDINMAVSQLKKILPLLTKDVKSPSFKENLQKFITEFPAELQRTGDFFIFPISDEADVILGAPEQQ